MNRYKCQLGSREEVITAKTERNAKLRFQNANKMWSNSVTAKLVEDIEELAVEQY